MRAFGRSDRTDEGSALRAVAFNVTKSVAFPLIVASSGTLLCTAHSVMFQHPANILRFLCEPVVGAQWISCYPDIFQMQ